MKKLLTTLTLLILLFTFCFPSLVLANTPYTRIAALDRYGTASQIATSGWQQSDYAVLCYGENFPDALASAPLAKKYNAPILLTAQYSLPESTKQALTSLQVKSVIIVGGTGVISNSIDSQLQSIGISVSRVFGNDKYETAIKIAEQVSTTSSSIFVCNGDDFGDALSVAPIASIQQSPIILVSNDSIPDSVKSYIVSHNISKTFAIGFTDIISDSIINQFPNPQRITGSDKYSRNVNVNKYFNNVFVSSGCGIATGEQFADALSSTAYCAKISEPLVLVNFNSPNDTRNYYQQRMGDQSRVFVFGGTAVLPDNVINGLGDINSGTSTNIPSTGNYNPVVTPSPSTNQLSDSDFQNYLNQNFGTLTINSESVHFSWMVNKFKTGSQNNIVGLINPTDYITWLGWTISNRQQLSNFGSQLNTAVANNYPNQSYIGDLVYQGLYSFYPTAYKANEVTYDASSNQWRVTHTILGFGDMKTGGYSMPIVDVR